MSEEPDNVNDSVNGNVNVNVCVVGCGAIGSLFAGHLARVPGVTVWGLDVSAAHVDAINLNGLQVTGPEEFRVRFEARTDPADIPPCELGIIATKSEYTRDAMSSAAAIFADAAVATVQNGIGNEEIVAEYASRVIRASTLLAGSIVEPGVVHLDASGDTWMGPFESQPATHAEVALLAAKLTQGGLPTHAMEDARGAQWTKLVFNAATNAIGAATGLTIGQVGSTPGLRSIVSSLIAEGRAVAAALGIELDSDPEAMIDDAIAHAYWHRASMLQDVSLKRPTEVNVLNGGIVAEGRRVGVPTPLNETLVAIIEGIQMSWVAPPPAE